MPSHSVRSTEYWQRLGYAVVVAGLIMATTVNVHAQALYGSLVGNVVDESGAVVPGATVTITQKETNQTREQVTPPNGAYSFPNLQPGTYDVVVTLPGFQTFSSRGITVQHRRHRPRRCKARAGHSRRVRRRDGRSGDSAGRQRGAAVGDDGTGAREPSDQRSELPEPADADSRCRAALVLPDWRHQQPVTFDAGIRERATEHEYGLPPRRHVGDQSVDSGTSGLQSRHRGDRNREHRHEQL